MTKQERDIEAPIVLAKIRALGFKPYVRGDWIIYSPKIPNKLLMRALAVPYEMFNLLRESQDGKPTSTN